MQGGAETLNAHPTNYTLRQLLSLWESGSQALPVSTLRNQSKISL